MRLIDADAAIDIVEFECGEWSGLARTIIEAIKQLPPAQPERKKGNWVYGYGEDRFGIDGYHCNKCGFFVPWDYTHKFINYIDDYNLCPKCGADMRR